MFDWDRLMRWVKQTPRPPANTAFTAGEDRDAAYLVEQSEMQLRDRILRLEQVVSRFLLYHQPVCSKVESCNLCTPARKALGGGGE